MFLISSSIHVIIEDVPQFRYLNQLHLKFFQANHSLAKIKKINLYENDSQIIDIKTFVYSHIYTIV